MTGVIAQYIVSVFFLFVGLAILERVLFAAIVSVRAVRSLLSRL